jgi:hypothetical protein
VTVDEMPALRRGWRPAAWFLLAFTATGSCGIALGHAWFSVPVNLVLAWLIVRPQRSAWLVYILITAILPIIYMFFMLFFGCAVWNSLAGSYRCGL